MILPYILITRIPIDIQCVNTTINIYHDILFFQTGSNPLLGNTTHQEIKVCKDKDLDTEACRLLNSTDPTICQNNCIATNLCPSFCGTCREFLPHVRRFGH